MSKTLSNFLSITTVMDLSVTSNIIFVAVTAALCAVFSAAVIGIAVRGKRKCAPFDVILRVFASIVLFVSAVLYASSWLCRLDGGVRIDVSVPVFIAGGAELKLPMPQLFAALQTMLGSNLMLGVLVSSLVALICDCAIAGKKEADKAAAKARKRKKTPEELKRDAEIARIRRLANSAAEKTATAANSNKEGGKLGDIKAGETAPSGAELEKYDGAAGESALDEPDFDWRVEQPKKQYFSFASGDASGAADGKNADGLDFFDNSPDDGADTDFQPEEAGNADKPDEKDAFEQYQTAEYAQDDEHAHEQQNVDAEGDSDRAEQVRNDSILSDDSIEPDRNIYIPEIRKIVRYKRVESKPEKQETLETNHATAKSAAANRTTAKQAAAKSTAKSTTAKSTAKKAAAADTDAAPPRKKSASAAKSQSTGGSTRKSAKGANGTSASGAKGKKVSDADSDNKKLPVTRRYVIINRTSAVNIFSEYLKSKNEDDKNKLESSLSTIILE